MTNNFFTYIPDYNGIGVYALINNRTDEMYIGATQNVHKRIMQHKSSPSRAIRAAVESGDTFHVKILENLPSGSNQFDMFGREKYFIDLYDTINHGYNKSSTTCCTKEELLQSLEHFKHDSEMSAYILNIIAKRERPIYTCEEESVEDIRIRVPKGQKSIIKAHAEQQGESMNHFVTRAINETMERDSEE